MRFTNEEKLIINSITENINIATFSKSDLVGTLAFSRSITTDDGVLELLDGILKKITKMSDSEWDVLKFKFPFDTDYEID